MTLVISTSYLLKEGPLHFLVVIGSVYGLGTLIGYPVWRYRRLHDPAYAARHDEQTKMPWSILGWLLLISGAAVVATPGWWRVPVVLLATCVLALWSGVGTTPSGGRY